MATKLAKMVADFSTTLATKIEAGGTTFTLQSIVDDDGNDIPDGMYYFTIDGNNSQKEHFYCSLSAGVASSVLSVSRQGATGSGAEREHRVGAQVVITDFAHIFRFNELLNGTTGFDASAPLSYDGNPTFNADNQIVTKKFVADTITGVSGTASNTTFGTVKLSVAASNPAIPIVVGDNDTRVPTINMAAFTQAKLDALAGTGTPSGSNKFVTADTDALKELLANKDTDGTLAANSDTKYPSQKAIKTYVDARTGAGAYNAAVLTSVNRLGVNNETTNEDQTVTLSFQPRFIKVYYYISGRIGSAGVGSRYGFAIFSGTTLIANYNTWGVVSSSGSVSHRTSTNNDYPDYPNALTNTDFILQPDGTNTISAGHASSGTTGLEITLTINSVSSTGFVFRKAIIGNSGCSAQYVQFHGWYEAFV